MTAAASFESSPLADFTDGEAGEPALYRVLAVAFSVFSVPLWFIVFWVFLDAKQSAWLLRAESPKPPTPPKWRGGEEGGG